MGERRAYPRLAPWLFRHLPTQAASARTPIRQFVRIDSGLMPQDRSEGSVPRATVNPLTFWRDAGCHRRPPRSGRLSPRFNLALPPTVRYQVAISYTPFWVSIC